MSAFVSISPTSTFTTPPAGTPSRGNSINHREYPLIDKRNRRLSNYRFHRVNTKPPTTPATTATTATRRTMSAHSHQFSSHQPTQPVTHTSQLTAQINKSSHSLENAIDSVSVSSKPKSHLNIEERSNSTGSSTSSESESSSSSQILMKPIEPQHQAPISSHSQTAPHPILQPLPYHTTPFMNNANNHTTTSSYRRKPSVKRFARTSTSSSMSSSPNFGDREEPKIHSKLYCEQVEQLRSVASPTIKNAAKDALCKLSSDDLRSVKSHTELAETANGVRMLAKNLLKATIQLDVKAIMIVTKARDNSLIYLTREIVEWLLSKDNDITVFVDAKLQSSKRFNAPDIINKFPKANNNLRYWTKKLALRSPEIFDLVVTLGGDGTVLYVSNLFQRVVPPVISFSLGSLGFLTNFQFDDFRERMTHCIEAGVKANLRMRFTCRVHNSVGKLICEQQVLNELVVDRGPSPYVTNLELFGDGSLLTVAQADGLIIATPTGSTAYSLSAGGSLVHPGVSAISVTPICPHTLSFRPILLPDGMFLKVKVPDSSRSTAWASFDGKVRTELFKGYYVTIQASPFPFPTVTSSKTEYIDSVSRNLHWNVREQQKPFSSYLTPENQKMLRQNSNGLPDLENLQLDEKFDINYSDDEEEGQTIENGVNNTTSNSTSEEDEGELEDYYIPPGDGTLTPMNMSYNSVDDRCCYAHPHARISLNGQRY